MDTAPVKRAILRPQSYAQVENKPLAGKLTLDLKWREPLLIFTVWRMLLLILPFLAPLFLESNERTATAPFVVGNYFDGTLDFWSDRLLAVWGRWDGEWYLQIVNHGYNPPEAAPAFFPLYPLLLKLVGALFYRNYLLGGILLSSGCTLIVFVLLYNLTLRDFKSSLLARDTVVIFSLFPTVFFLAALYTEALFMALALGAFYVARHLRIAHRWWVVAVLVALASLTRNVGILLVPALAWEWWRQNRLEGQRWRVRPGSLPGLAALVALPALALASWQGAIWAVLGDPLLFIKAQSSLYWKRRSALPWETGWQTFTSLFSIETFSDSNLINFMFLVGWLGLMGVAGWLVYRRKFPASYLLFMGLAFVPGMCAPRPDQPLFAIPRYFLVLFPAYQVLGVVLVKHSGRFKTGFYLLSAAGLAYLTFRFVQWIWVA